MLNFYMNRKLLNASGLNIPGVYTYIHAQVFNATLALIYFLVLHKQVF